MKKMTTKLIIGSATLLLLSGCGVVSSSLSPEKQGALKGKKVTVVQKDTLIKPGQSARTSSYIDVNIVTGIIQGIENRKTSGPVYARPTYEISKRTMALLSNKFGMIEVKNIGQKNFQSDYSLEVRTGWGIQYGKLMMANDIKLIDLKSNKVIAHSICMYGDNRKERIPATSTKKLFANDGKIIKREARKAIDSCMKKINTQILARPSESKPITDPDFMHRPLIDMN